MIAKFLEYSKKWHAAVVVCSILWGVTLAEAGGVFRLPPVDGIKVGLLAMGRRSPNGRLPVRADFSGMTFIRIPSGSFWMGSPQGERGRDPDEVLHRVTITQGFFIQQTEVTQGQWQAVMDGNPAAFGSCGNDCPVENVSWDEIQTFIIRLNQREGGRFYRLPTEAEWEYACRAGTRSHFSCGDCLGPEYANYQGDYPLSGCAKGVFRGKTVPVASLRPNAWDIFDMHGNVAEWCQDRYGPYPPDPVTDPGGSGVGDSRVIRGGAWRNGARLCRSAARTKGPPGVKSGMLGFRLVRKDFGR